MDKKRNILCPKQRLYFLIKESSHFRALVGGVAIRPGQTMKGGNDENTPHLLT